MRESMYSLYNGQIGCFSYSFNDANLHWRATDWRRRLTFGGDLVASLGVDTGSVAGRASDESNRLPLILGSVCWFEFEDVLRLTLPSLPIVFSDDVYESVLVQESILCRWWRREWWWSSKRWYCRRPSWRWWQWIDCLVDLLLLGCCLWELKWMLRMRL